MAWARRTGTDPKYRSREHLAYTAALKAQLAAQGYLICKADACTFPSRIITNPNGNAPDGLTAGHNPDGVTYNGPEHRRCNIHEAAVRANARSRGQGKPQRWEI